MANALYPSFKAGLLVGSFNLGSDDIRAALVDTGTVTYNSAHDFVNDISAGIVARSGSLTSKTTTGGTFDAGDITVSAVSGSTVEAVAIYKFNASDASAALIVWIDNPAISFTPNGSDVLITWDPSGIFSL